MNFNNFLFFFKGYGKCFLIKFVEVIVLLMVVGILFGFVMVWIVYILVVKWKYFIIYKLVIVVDKKVGMKVDEMKD